VRDGKANEFTALGSGVLVQRGSRFGILTARHCLHACGAVHARAGEVLLGPSGRDTLCLSLRGGRGILVQPQEVKEHPLVTPQSDEFGPDLAFIEVLPGDRLTSFKANGSFWSLDQNPGDLAKDFARTGWWLASIGFPQVYYDTLIDGNSIRHAVQHQTYITAIQDGDIFERDGWDYIEVNMDYNCSGALPDSFKGVSGGPVWCMQLRKHKVDGHLTIEKSALVGIIFYETGKRNNQQRLRAHFIRSIYDLAWRGIGV